MKNYLISHNFNKYWSQLKNKLKNKRIVIYGAGKLFKEISESYNLADLNIIGITDKKYLSSESNNFDFGYKIIPYNDIDKIDADVILIAVQNYISIKANLENMLKSHNKVAVIPMVKLKFNEIILYYLKQNILFERVIHNITMNKNNNNVILIKNNGEKVYNPKIKNLKVNFYGKNSYIEIHSPINIKENVYISCRDSSKVIIGSNVEIKKAKILMGSNNILNIGKNTTIVEVSIPLYTTQNSKITIGEDCQLAYQIQIRATDAHTIYDINTKEVLNPDEDVTIGNHVWITRNVTILKGVSIPSNCVIGTHSLLNKKFFKENCIIAGTPAKIIKENINWDRRSVYDFTK